jgi:hypothetical protein
MLEVGNGGMTPDEYRMHFSLWAMIAAPLIAGNDLRAMTPEIQSILMNKDVISIDQDSLGKGGSQLAPQGSPANGDVVVWTKPLADGGFAVAFFNRGKTLAQSQENAVASPSFIYFFADRFFSRLSFRRIRSDSCCQPCAHDRSIARNAHRLLAANFP